MKSRISTFLFGIALSLTFAGCGGGGSSSSSPSTPTTTSTTLSASATSVTAGASVTLTATVSASSGSPSGSVNFYDGSTSLGSASLSGATATYSVTSITAGSHSYTATYAGNSSFSSSTSAAVSVTAAATAPSAPTGLAAAGATGSVALTWTAASSSTSYNVKRSTDGATFATLSSPTTNSYTDSSVTNGVKYYYEVTAVNSAGESSPSSVVNATPLAAPGNLTATVNGYSVALTWTAVSGAASYTVKRSATSGGGYATISSPTTNSYTDSSLAVGTYYYVVIANGNNSTSSTSAQAGATVATITTIAVTVDATKNRHPISPLIYGYNFPANTAYIASVPGGLVRWGGNASSNYNYTNGATNAAADWYFQNRPFGDASDPLNSSAASFITNTLSNGGAPITTLPMLGYVAKDTKASSYSFSVAKYGAQCKTNPYYADDGNGVKSASDCTTNPTYVTGNNLSDAYVELLDSPHSGDPADAVYRSKFVTDSLLPAFQSGSKPHFYNMDNEMDIWGGTHRDVHPNGSSYEELATTFISEARALKGWDPNAITFGPVGCCWWYYWNSDTKGDKAAHGGIDFLPYWLDAVQNDAIIHGSSTLDVFDIHAYADGPDTKNFTTAQKQALAASIARDFWDPSYVSGSTTVTQPWATSTQTNYSHPFRIPRMRALGNLHGFGRLAFTEWNAAVAGESDFSTALYDADMYGVFGREEMFAASRWTAAESTTPAYQALKLFVNPAGGGLGSGFESTSVDCANNGGADLFSCYAAVSTDGSRMTIVVINKDPANANNVSFNLNGFTPSSYVGYSISNANSSAIAASSSAAWSSTQSFAPYSITLLSISGATANPPAVEWMISPDAIQNNAGVSEILPIVVLSGSSTGFNIVSATMDNGVVSNGSGSSILTQTQSAPSVPYLLTFTTPSTPDFYRITVKATDSTGVQQTQQAWLIVGKPAATLTVDSSSPTTATHGSPVTVKFKFAPGNSGASASGVSILVYPSSGGAFTPGEVKTDSTGVASYTFTPSAAGSIEVVAKAPHQWTTSVATTTLTVN